LDGDTGTVTAQSVVPLLNAVGAASYAVGTCNVLILGFEGEYGWTTACPVK